MKAMNCDETNSRNLPKDWKSDLMIPKDCGLVLHPLRNFYINDARTFSALSPGHGMSWLHSGHSLPSEWRGCGSGNPPCSIKGKDRNMSLRTDHIQRPCALSWRVWGSKIHGLTIAEYPDSRYCKSQIPRPLNVLTTYVASLLYHRPTLL